MTVRLHPNDLGMVQVRIERTPSGATQIAITAEKTETLQVLQRDQIRLHHTLDEAGIPAAGRTVTFHVSQPAQATPIIAGQDSGQHAPGSRMNNAAADPGNSAGGGRGSYAGRDASRWGGRSGNDSAAPADTMQPAAVRSYRVGLDITA